MPSQSHDRTARTNRIYMLTNGADYNTLLQAGQARRAIASQLDFFALFASFAVQLRDFCINEKTVAVKAYADACQADARLL